MNQAFNNEVVKKPALPWHGWLLGGIFLLFGLASAFDYVMSFVQGEAYYRASGMTDFQVAYFSSVPEWAIIGWTLSVWGSLFAGLALLLRNRFASALFATSLFGGLLYMLYTLVLSAGKDAMGVLWVMPIIIALFTGFMIFYSQRLLKYSRS